MLGHDGGTIGQSAFLRVVPDAGVAVALLTNGGNPIALFRELCGELLPSRRTSSCPPRPSRRRAADARPVAYLGTYERAGASIEVVARDDGSSPCRR